FISAAGGMIGTFLGMAIPISVRLFTDYHLPISGLSIIVAVVVSSLVGLIFGTVPSSRAANLDPVESLRYELTRTRAHRLRSGQVKMRDNRIEHELFSSLRMAPTFPFLVQ